MPPQPPPIVAKQPVCRKCNWQRINFPKINHKPHDLHCSKSRHKSRETVRVEKITKANLQAKNKNRKSYWWSFTKVVQNVSKRWSGREDRTPSLYIWDRKSIQKLLSKSVRYHWHATRRDAIHCCWSSNTVKVAVDNLDRRMRCRIKAWKVSPCS